MPTATLTVQKNAIGVRIEVSVTEDGSPMDISAATTHTFVVKKAGGSVVTWAASFLTDGSDGVLIYDTLSGDLDAVGSYRLQCDLVIPGTYTGRTSPVGFHVGDNI